MSAARPAHRPIALAIVGWAVAGATAIAESREFSFKTNEGHEFRGVIDLPPGGVTPQTHAVLMLGGGVANDLDWSVPAEYSLSGEPHADAPILSRALTEAGFVTARWSTIRVADPKADQWPQQATLYTYAQSLEQATGALAALREQGLVAPDRVILLGHSLGARRALNICETDERIPAVVCLSGADIARTCFEDRKQAFRGEVGRIFGEMDRTGDGRVEQWECDAWAPLKDDEALGHDPALPLPAGPLLFATLDADADGVVRAWEVGARLAILARRSPDLRHAETPSPRRAWGEDVLAARGLPALLIYGGLDPWAAQGVIVRDRAIDEGLESVNTVFMPGLGHNLSEERDGKMGPISSRATEAVVGWLRTRF